MLIGELSRKTGCSRDTLRFYEKIGLMKGYASPRSGNGYKNYDPALVEHVLLIKCAKTLGFTLPEIRNQILAWEGNHLSRREKQRILSEKIDHIEDKIREMRQVRRYLETKLKTISKPGR
jgi:MerR family Zn(II)-responsive transcriptional regulator of zntA